MNAVFDTIDNHKSKAQRSFKDPCHLTESFERIHFVNKLLIKLSTKNFPHYMTTLQYKWSHYQLRLLDIATANNFPLLLPSVIDNSTYSSIRSSVKQLHKTLMFKYDQIDRAYQDKQIHQFVQN